MRKALRGRQSGVDLKPPQVAVVKSDGGERCGKVGTRFRQARLREASASEPPMKCVNENVDPWPNCDSTPCRTHTSWLLGRCLEGSAFQLKKLRRMQKT